MAIKHHAEVQIMSVNSSDTPHDVGSYDHEQIGKNLKTTNVKPTRERICRDIFLAKSSAFAGLVFFPRRASRSDMNSRLSSAEALFKKSKSILFKSSAIY